MPAVIDKLMDSARAGERLNVKERRMCVKHVMLNDRTATNVALAELFQVSEKQIRLDKVFIREERAQLVREDDPALVVADIALTFEQQIRDLEKGKTALQEKGVKGKSGVGTRTWLEYCKSIFAMELQRVKALQDLGYFPKNLGNLTINKFEYTASVSVMGEGAKPAVIERAESEEVLDAEFSDVDVEGNAPLLQLEAPAAEEVI